MGEESQKNTGALTRRDFARAAVMAAATAAVPAGIAAAAPRDRMEPANHGTSVGADDAAALRQAEIDARTADIFRRWGDRLSPEEKNDIRRLAGELQIGLDKLRAYSLGNGDQPATVLRIVPDLAEAHRAPRR
jgi:hypothetical protein